MFDIVGRKQQCMGHCSTLYSFIIKKDQHCLLALTMIKQINGRGEFAYFKNLNLYKVELINAVTSSN